MTKQGYKVSAILIFTIGLIALNCVRPSDNIQAANRGSNLPSPGAQRLPGSFVAAFQSAQTAELAEEKYKNIKVFKGLPASQLLNAMFFMRGALGISCNHCHVNFSDFEKDDNPKKQTARQMIEMVRDLNQKQFGGREVVTCNTCHRGSIKPTAPLGFAPIVEPGTTDKTAAPPTAAAATPTVDQIFDRYVTASGGRVALGKFNSQVLNGSMFSSEGWKAPLRIYLELPGKYLVTFDLTKWTSFQAYDGATGWSQDNHGLHDVTGKGLDLLRRDGAIFSPLELRGQYSKLTFIGTEDINGHPAFVVQGDLPSAGAEKLYFDAGSGLLVRISAVTITPLGELPRQTEVMDYQTVDGVKIPFTVIRQAPDFSSAYRLTDVKHDLPITDIKFAKPAQPLSSVQGKKG